MNNNKTLTEIEQEEEEIFQQQNFEQEDLKATDMFRYIEWFYDGEIPDWD